MDGMLLRAGLVATPVRRQRDWFAGDVSGDGLAVRRNLAANAIRERQKNGPANLEYLVTELVVALIQQPLGFG